MNIEAPEPILVPISAAITMSGLSRSELYRRFSAGQIACRKAGRTTLVSVESLKSHLASLPVEIFRAPTQAA